MRRRRDSQDIDNGTVDKRGMFPDVCMICKKKKIIVSGKDCYINRIVNFKAEQTLKKAAEMKNDEHMLLIINDVDLIAKEYKTHDKCYCDYTRIFYQKPKEE